MNPTDPTTHLASSPTLDVDRTDRLRTFLVVEAAADLARTRAHQPGRGTAVRRLAIGGLAAAMLVGAMIALDAGTTTKANRADAAISITQEDGWTTLELNDPHASATEVLAELHAAGIPATTAIEGSDSWGNEPMTADGMIGTFTEAGASLQAGGHVDPGTITQINVEFHAPDGLALPDAGQPEGVDRAPTPELESALDAYERAIGVRSDLEAHTVSIRNGQDNPVILFVAP